MSARGAGFFVAVLVVSPIVLLVSRGGQGLPGKPSGEGASAGADSVLAPARRIPLRDSPGSAHAHPKQRGVSLGLFAEDVSFDYTPLLTEIAALGATSVRLVVPIYQEHAASTVLSLHTRFSPGLA